MNRTKRSASTASDEPTLPPGQYEVGHFPRFGLWPFARRFPRDPGSRQLKISGDVEHPVTLDDPLRTLPRVERTYDFHCVTTWTHRGLRWSGVRFRDVYDELVCRLARPRAGADFVILRGQDGYAPSLPLSDLLSDDVLLADRLNGDPLSIEHGAPLRLVAPAHYGYKSPKHLKAIEFWCDDGQYRSTAFRFMDHPRARVALEERGRLPGRLLRLLYRPLVGPTIRRFRRALDDHRS